MDWAEGDPGLSLGERAALRLRHTALLGRAVVHHASSERLWWFVPLVVLVVLLALAATATSSAVPVAVYTLF